MKRNAIIAAALALTFATGALAAGDPMIPTPPNLTKAEKMLFQAAKIGAASALVDYCHGHVEYTTPAVEFAYIGLLRGTGYPGQSAMFADGRYFITKKLDAVDSNKGDDNTTPDPAVIAVCGMIAASFNDLVRVAK